MQANSIDPFRDWNADNDQFISGFKNTLDSLIADDLYNYPQNGSWIAFHTNTHSDRMNIARILRDCMYKKILSSESHWISCVHKHDRLLCRLFTYAPQFAISNAAIVQCIQFYWYIAATAASASPTSIQCINHFQRCERATVKNVCSHDTNIVVLFLLSNSLCSAQNVLYTLE